ncbi:MAG: hypothetical protein R2787_16910 [Saprospiraceae bacterium]
MTSLPVQLISCPPDLVDRLRTNLLTRLHQGQMHPAGIGRAIGSPDQCQYLLEVHLISWLDDAPEDEAEAGVWR